MFKRLFNISIYVFVLLVPILPLKIKLGFLPLSADFIISSILIFFGLCYLLFEGGLKELYNLKDKGLRKLNLFIGLFVFLNIISFFIAPNKGAAISESLRFFEYVFLFYFIVLLADKRTIKRAFMLFFASMVVAALYGVIQFIFGLSPYTVNRNIRLNSTFVNPNYWGAAVNIVIFYPIVDMIKERKIKIYNVLFLALFLFNLLFSLNRSSWLAFLLGLFVILLIENKKFIAILPAFILPLIAHPFTRKRFITLLSIEKITKDARFKLWKTAYLMFKDHFVLGVGHGNYRYFYDDYIKRFPELFVRKDLWSPHNSFLKMFAEMGIFGGLNFIFIYIMLFYLVIVVYNKTRDYKVIALNLIGFWVSYLFQNNFNNLMFIPQLNVFAWLLTALLYKAYVLEAEEEF
ncbi:O-antigen ligase family protein [Caloramator sp. CAR-1]|uniref:O-antigen ligase family protein n=1 Tax=Caloramator sp. CAR-1 TaxID=3062777 RepID=UPI0026E3AEA0|nr:O-antigen ligase family protein [Caloramator sp. CAR-1]MDO6355573.1 O-antigen ligase family protein [Caloramator sp. CAR-1]